MCIFTSDKDIPSHVRLTTRTIQYLIIPLLSLSLLTVGKLPFLYEAWGHILENENEEGETSKTFFNFNFAYIT